MTLDFKAKLVPTGPKGAWCFLYFPFDVVKTFGARDHLSHGYDDVDYQVLWDAVEKDVPVLLMTVEQMLRDLEADREN